MRHERSRREFIRETVSLGLGLGLAGGLASRALAATPVDSPKTVPTSTYGSTGERIPRVILGAGSRFCNIVNPEESDLLLNTALDHGMFFWDSAAIYENTKLGIHSEERLARVLRTRRREVFLSTKITERTPDAALRQFEGSLKRLGVSKLDQLMIHDIRSKEDNDLIRRKGGLVDIVHRLREEGVTRYIGFSGHSSAEAKKELLENYDFNSVLVALNHWDKSQYPREQVVLPAAKAKGMAVFVMKAVRPREKDPTLTPTELIRYALTLPQPDALVLGIDSMRILMDNIALLQGFQPLPPSDMRRISLAWERFQQHGHAPWHHPDYIDGHWA